MTASNLQFLSTNHRVEFANAMQADGISFKGMPIDDGELHRFRVEGDRAGAKNGWYCLFGDGVPAGVYSNWKVGEKFTWCAKSQQDMSASEKAAHRCRIETAKQQRKAEQARAYLSAAASCTTLWDKATTVSAEHHYLRAKAIPAFNIRQYKEALLIPVRDKDGNLTSLQFINPDGSKRFKSGGKIRGCYTSIGKPSETVYIAEGYATATTIHQATNSIVVVAFNAGNLATVTEVIRKKYPNKTLILCADNDTETEGNPGIKAVKAASANHDIAWTYPDMDGAKCDFNDLYQSKGLEVVSSQIKANLQTPESREPEDESSSGDIESENIKRERSTRFTVSSTGVFYRDDNDESTPVCSPLYVTATTRDTNQDNFGKLLEWKDPDDHPHQWAMPSDFLAGDGRDIFRALLSGGLSFIHNKKRLIEYVATYPVNFRARCVTKTGWHDSSFVLPDTVIGTSDSERLILQNGESGANHYKIRGSLEDWQRDVSDYCVGNSRLVFAVSVAFAAPLLELAGMDGGGFNFRGSSSEGKSTALQVATSVCGGPDYLCTWRATSNGLEGVAAVHNDALLVLDEMGQVAPKEAGEIAYMLANGQGKQRAGRNGAARSKHEWRTLFLSSGEISLADHLLSNGQTIKAGQEVRLADIPMNTGFYGGFEELHSFSGGAQLADHLKVASSKVYGVPFRKYLQKISNQLSETREAVKVLQDEFIEEFCPGNADGQVRRVALRFALVAAGGDFATSLGITGWPEDASVKAAETCFKEWLKERGTVENTEGQKALETIMNFIQLHGSSRFENWASVGDRTIMNRAGYIHTDNEESRFYVFCNVFKSEICRGIDYKLGLKALEDKGLLVADTGRKDISRKRPGATNSARFYCILGSVISDE